MLSLPDEIILIVGEPNNNNNEDCLALLHEQGNNWNDQGCDKTQYGFICMKPGSFSSIMR